MTARKISVFAPSVDEIWRGFRDALLAHPEDPQPPTPEQAQRTARACGRESVVLQFDDWHRGVVLARDCLARCRAGMQPRRETSPFVHSHEGSLRAIAQRVMYGEGGDNLGGIPDEDLYPDDLEALDLLREFSANIAETGDPDLSTDPAGDDDEQIAGDDEQGAVLSRLRWADDGRGGRVLVSSPWEDCPE